MKKIILLLLIVFHGYLCAGQMSREFMPTAFNVADTTLKEDEYFDEVLVTLNIPRIGSYEIQALVYNEVLYLPIKDLFDVLKIRNTISPDFDLVEGFFIYPKDNYSMDKTNNRIVFQNKSFALKPTDLIRTSSNLYLKADYFGEIFGLECVFDFRNLAVTLYTSIELPSIREMKQELMRRNISQLKGERKADTTIGRSFPFFHIGMLDWAINASQETKGLNHTRLNLGIGALLAGGELNVLLNYYNQQPTQLRQQFYQWRYVDNDHIALRQITAGKIYPRSTSTIFAPVIGMQVSNTPTTYRRSFGTFIVSNTTQPGWTVELYINNVLVNFTKADASGFFTFEIPMVYGNSVIKYRFYGPWGEEQVLEKYISVPFNFIPVNQLEYNISAGVVENNDKGRFTRADLNYGVSRRFTVGGGVEYLSTVTSGKTMPFVHASLLLGARTLVSGEHNKGVNSKLAVNYRLLSNLQFDFVYIKYVRGQTAIRVGQLEEKKLVISMPIKSKRFNAFSRLTLNQFTFPFNDITPTKNNIRYTSAEYLFSSVIAGVNSNLTTYTVFTGNKHASTYSNLSLGFRLPKGFRFSPQAQYEFSQQKLSMVRARVEKNIFLRGFLDLSYEKNLINTKTTLLTVGLRYNFGFGQLFTSATKIDKKVFTNQSARGSLMLDAKTSYLGVSNQTQVGRGGVVIIPFLDLNCNGKRDPDEPRAFGLRLQINGGRIEADKGDTTIRVSGLEAYASYYIELDKSGFENIAWQISRKTIKVMADPNLYKHIEVAVTVVGEVSGTVSFAGSSGSKGIGRIIVNIYDSASNLVTKILTEEDGYFSFIGLAPGTYIARVDETQLAKLSMQSSKEISFTIDRKVEGDIADGLRFVLVSSVIHK